MLKDHFAPKKVLGICGLIILFAYSGWLAKETTTPSTKQPVQQNHPDFFTKNLHAVEFSEQGKILHILKTPFLLHYPLKNSANLTTPHFIIYSDDTNGNDKAPWHITSDKGHTKNGTDIITLIGHVVIHQPKSKNNNDITIKTSKMTVYSKENYAITHQPVTIEEPGIVVNAVGMKVYFKEKRVILLSQARGVYDEKEANNANSN